MDETRTVAGLYIERSKALLLTATIRRTTVVTWEFQSFDDYQEYEWGALDDEDAQRMLYDIGQDIGELGKDGLKSVGIAGYGPFLSLDPNDSKGRYGVVNPNTSNQPFRGVNLYALFADAIKSKSGSTNIRMEIHTDANACALGEAIRRNEGPDKTLLYMLVTEGIGCGIVTGRNIHQSALHPELGLISVRFDAKDHLKPPKPSNLYAYGLGYLANNNSLRLRNFKDSGEEHISDTDLSKVSNDSIWDLRAYYLAQGCLACTALFAPHHIVIGADIDRENSSHHNNTAELTRKKFASFISERRSEKAPLFDYDALDEEDGFKSFISAPTPFPVPGLPHSPRVTGAIGMCAVAAEMAK